ncbi:hypothetical protein GCM10010404_76980 [Nonomuraea africana]|uniref:Uncharacterized protein n=1 Tax=Nonomuraea africana TaxID=46171 RepID=A0ABR9KQ12_9ACTN|nr:hypothetical protein [Nonomuraea africana]MBE1564112.1 hypothetical protein [Nonomuraea africana]
MRFTAIEADVRAMVTDPRWTALPLQSRAHAIASRALATPDGGRWIFGAHARWYLQDPIDGRWHLTAPPRQCPARIQPHTGVLLPHLVPRGPDFAFTGWSSQAFVGPDVPAALTAEIRALVRANGRRSVDDFPLSSFREVFASDVPGTVAAIWATIMWCAYAPAFDGNEQLLSVFGEYLGRPLPGDEWVRWLPSPPLTALVTLYGERIRAGAARAALRLAALMADTAGILAADARFAPRAQALIAMLEPTLRNPALDHQTATGPLPVHRPPLAPHRLPTGPLAPPPAHTDSSGAFRAPSADHPRAEWPPTAHPHETQGWATTGHPHDAAGWATSGPSHDASGWIAAGHSHETAGWTPGGRSREISGWASADRSVEMPGRTPSADPREDPGAAAADDALRWAWLARVPDRLARAVLAETDPGEHLRHTVGDLLEAVAFAPDPHRTAAALLAADHVDAPEGLPTVSAWLDHRLRHALHTQLAASHGEDTEPDGFEVGPRWLDTVPPTREEAAAVLGAAYASGLAWCRLTGTPVPGGGFPGAAAIVHRLIHERDDPHLNH